MGFDAHLIDCFLTVARERSFSRAAETLRISQSAVSERIQRLETMLGFLLFVRTSRKVSLSAAGSEFIPYADDLAKVSELAVQGARKIHARITNILRIGAFDYQSTIPLRRRLIDRFMDSYPDTELEIVSEPVGELMARLRRQEIDVMLSLNLPQLENDNLEFCRFGVHIAAVLMPAEDFLADEPEVKIENLGGRQFLLSPGKYDPFVIGHLSERLRSVGASVTHAPEPDRNTIEHLARRKRCCCLRWGEDRVMAQADGDMRIVPIVDNEFTISFDAAVLSQKQRAPVQKFMQMARDLAQL